MGYGLRDRIIDLRDVFGMYPIENILSSENDFRIPDFLSDFYDWLVRTS